MRPDPVRLIVVGLAAALAIVAIAASVADERRDPVPIATGTIYSTADGDPIDVFAGPGDDPGTVCTNVGGFFYGSGGSCFEVEDADQTGSYVLVIPESRRKPPLVVGLMPAGASGATAHVEQARTSAQTRGRWFLVSLEPSSLGSNNATPVSVDFE